MPTVSYAKLYTLTAVNGYTLRFTDLTYDIDVGGNIFTGNAVYKPSARATNNELSADNLEIESILDSDNIDEFSLSSGFWDNAKIVVDIYDVGRKVILANHLTGFIGETRITNLGFTFEVRSLASLLNTKKTVKMSAICPWKFGDSRCTFDLNTVTFTGSVTAISAATAGQENICQVTLPAGTYGALTIALLEEGELTFTNPASDEIGQQSRTILSVISSVVGGGGELILDLGLFHKLPLNMVIPQPCTVSQGCTKAFDQCLAYNNTDFYGGFPSLDRNWMPGNDRALSGR